MLLPGAATAVCGLCHTDMRGALREAQESGSMHVLHHGDNLEETEEDWQAHVLRRRLPKEMPHLPRDKRPDGDICVGEMHNDAAPNTACRQQLHNWDKHIIRRWWLFTVYKTDKDGF